MGGRLRRKFLLGCFLAASAQLAGGQDDLRQLRELIDGGDYTRAEARCRSLLSKTEAAAGSDSVEAASVIDLLVEALWRGGKGQLEESDALARRAIRIKERERGPDDPDLAISVRNYATLLWYTSRYNEARPLFERALAIQQRSLSADDPQLASTLNNFGQRLE